MYDTINLGSLTELNMDETMEVVGGGLVSLFLGCVGLAVSPAVACLNPAAGIGLGLVSGGTIVKKGVVENEFK
jgi:hypothetical protein